MKDLRPACLDDHDKIAAWQCGAVDAALAAGGGHDAKNPAAWEWAAESAGWKDRAGLLLHARAEEGPCSFAHRMP